MRSTLPWRLLLLLAATVLGLAACSSDDDTADDAEPEVEATAAETLTASAAAMREVESAAFTLSQTGAIVAIDEAGQLEFRSAEGQIVRPASAQAVVSVEALGFTTEVGAIAIDGTVWFTNPLTGSWSVAPPSFTFDPTVLLDPDQGLAGLLAEVAPTAESVGNAASYGGAVGPDEDGPFRVIRATVSGERVATLTGGLVAAETDVDVFVDTETDRVAHLSFELPIDERTSSWQLSITDYDVEVDISPPEQ